MNRESNFHPRSEAVAQRLMTVFESIDRGRGDATELTRLFDEARNSVMHVTLDEIAPSTMRNDTESWPFCLPVCEVCEHHVCRCHDIGRGRTRPYQQP